MRSVSVALRLRRRRRNRGGPARLRAARNVSLIAATGAIILLGLGFTSLGTGYLVAAADLPDVSTLAAIMGPEGEEVHRPARLFDRSGQVLLFELVHPLAAERRWVRLESLPAEVGVASVAALDPTFWSNEGYPPGSLSQALVAVLRGVPVEAGPRTLTQRLVEQTLTTGADARRPSQARLFRSVLLAGEATRMYSKQQILEWFLNTADFGNLAFGIDAAALVYLGKHAEDLTVAEAALLASIPADPGLNPLDDPAAAEANRRAVIEVMLKMGSLSAAQAKAAAEAKVTIRGEASARGLDSLGFVAHAWRELRSRLGPGPALQGGLTVVTTLDTDLQLQTDCVVRTQLARIVEGEPDLVVAAADGSTCVAAGLLPLLRPGRAVESLDPPEGAAIVLDPTTGEILAVSGAVEEIKPAGNALAPFIYLTAFSKGYTPATMVIDAPIDGEPGAVHGPIRMRTALANGYRAAAARTFDLSGGVTVARTAQQMGIRTVDASDAAALESLRSGEISVTLADLSFSYVAVANDGLVAGADSPGESQAIAPTILRSVVGPDGTVLYAFRQKTRAVLSAPLAYLLQNILSDESARWPTYGRGNALEIGRTSGAFAAVSPLSGQSWAVGFTPARVIGVHVGGAGWETPAEADASNYAAPIWHALMRYAVRDLPPTAWDQPAEISVVEVCDPSGYLPTPYCPNVVREVFVAGTEPTHADSLYQPYLVNRETGKLATLYTPADLVEERVYFVPPPEAEAWARLAGIEPPPTEYDTYVAPPANPDVTILEPEPFALLRGNVSVRGSAKGEDFDVYRVRYGRGLNPREWVQIGEDGTRPVVRASLAQWNTTELDGLYTLQLVVVRSDGTIHAAVVPVTIDNQAPVVSLILPEPETVFTWPDTAEILLQAQVADAVGVVRVDFLVDGAVVGTTPSEPWSMRWPLGRAGEHRLTATATDEAGNVGVSEVVVIVIER
ncbi:MAG TPA: transglycosylase domain-containing protein [Anaerolineales bacterium]|nr:transglycosylase domain-containing protein [Anaerolineales bacterium]